MGGMEELVSLMLRERASSPRDTGSSMLLRISELSSTESRLSALSRGVTLSLLPQVLSAGLLDIAKREHLVLPAEAIFFLGVPFQP